MSQCYSFRTELVFRDSSGQDIQDLLKKLEAFGVEIDMNDRNITLNLAAGRYQDGIDECIHQLGELAESPAIVYYDCDGDQGEMFVGPGVDTITKDFYLQKARDALSKARLGAKADLVVNAARLTADSLASPPNAQYAKGPWHVQESDKDGYGVWAGGIRVATCGFGQVFDRANARLIAAAPEQCSALMLAEDVLERASKALEQLGDEDTRGLTRSALIVVRETIAKST